MAIVRDETTEPSGSHSPSRNKGTARAHLATLRDMGSDRFVSTGHLPHDGEVARLVQETHERHLHVTDGEVSTVYPALSRVDPDLFGISVVQADGAVYEAGDVRTGFTIMSVAKPFVLALVAERIGMPAVRGLTGVNATGLPFNSVEAVDRSEHGRTNPMVNAGAIATTSLVPGRDLDARWSLLLRELSRFAGRELALDEETLESALATNVRNRAIAALLYSVGGIAGDPHTATELYTRQSCLQVTAHDLAVMGATLADGGVNPVTGEQVVSVDVARAVLAVMLVAGMYETSGDWLLDVGAPGKSGIGGGIVAVSPGKGGFGSFSPRLDAAGNSVRGQLAARDLATALGLDLLASQPAPHPGR